MEDLKTQNVVVSRSNKVKYSSNTMNLTEHQFNTVQVQEEPSRTQTIKEQLRQLKQNASDTRKIKHINPFASYFPLFYKKELKRAFNIFLIWTFLLIIILAACGYACYMIIRSTYCDSFVSLLLLPCVILSISLWCVFANRFYNFRGEAKNINFKDDKTMSINVIKLYKRLKTAYININFVSIISYVICLFTILINFIVAWILTDFPFGYWDYGYSDFMIYEVIFWSAVGVILITILMQAYLLVSSYMRASRIENFYNFLIVPVDEINALKKQKFRRDLVILLCTLVLVGLICYFIYKLAKRSKATKVVVQQ